MSLRGGDSTSVSLVTISHTAWCPLLEPIISSSATPTSSSRHDLPNEAQIAEFLGEAGLASRLAVHYRPIVDLSTGVVASIAARIRFTDPRMIDVPAKQVVRIAETTGAIIPIGAWLIRQSVHDLSDILQAPRTQGSIGLSLKVSTPELADEGFGTRVAQALTSAGVTPDSLILEITHPPADETNEVAGSLQLLRSLGVTLAVDESSMGPEAIAQLRALRIGEMRVAPDICQLAPTDPSSRATLSAIVGLARALGVITVATGIQSSEQLDTARALGVDRAQGALLGSPAPFDELISWLNPR